MWDSLKAKVTEMHDRSVHNLEEKRIKEALGRPVTRVILDREDNVILNVGEIITNKAVAASREADMLDVLLQSVDDEEPEIPNDALRAPERGDASLEATHEKPQEQQEQDSSVITPS